MNNIPTIPKILIIGHSFISRLAQDIQRDPILDVNLNLKQCEIRCFGVSGASLEILEKHNGLIEFMKQYKPSIVILQLVEMTSVDRIYDQKLYHAILWIS